MNPANLSKCPFTLTPLEDLHETSREHVILDALGGPDSYSVVADRDTNTKMGSSFDSAFVDDPLVSGLRTQYGVKSRSGVSEWTLTGTTIEGGRPVEVTIPDEGVATVHHKQPVLTDENGKIVSIIGSPEQVEAIFRKARAGYARKGMRVEGTQTSSPNQEIFLPFTIKLGAIGTGLMKIAYLACCERLGDKFLEDELNTEWQKAIRGQDSAKLKGGYGADVSGVSRQMLPRLEKHQHGIGVIRCNSQNIVVVRLFDEDLLTCLVQFSESQDFGFGTIDGETIVCDSLQRTIVRNSWINQLQTI